MCHKRKEIAGTLIGSVDDAFFSAPESQEIFQAIRKMTLESGESPNYRMLLEDPSLSKDSRSFFRDSQAEIQSVEEAKRAVKTLNKYRQVRSMFDMAMHIDEQMQKSKVDIDKLLEDCSTRIATARSTRTRKDAFLHFGLNNNSSEFVKDLLFGDHSEDIIPSCIEPFDKESGGFLRGGLTVIGASSGGGKCCSMDTRVQLSTIVIETDEFTVEVEPENRLLVNRQGELVLLPADQISEGDDVQIDLQAVIERPSDFPLCTEAAAFVSGLSSLLAIGTQFLQEDLG
jgi:replicative DNA helicase